MADTPKIVLELVGGSEDGAVYENGIANIYYRSADYGRVGARFRVIPEHTFLNYLSDTKEIGDARCEIYEIVERGEEWDAVYVRAEYLGRESDVPIYNDSSGS